MKFKQHEFTRTSTTTDTRRGIQHVYEVAGRFPKSACTRPFLSSVAACRRYVNAAIERQKDRDA